MRFRTSWTMTLTLMAVAAIFTRLGLWQLERAGEKQQLFRQFELAPRMQLDQALRQDDGFYRVEAYGQYDDTRHVLLDNKILNGRTGVHVITPFSLYGNSMILVNRGWLPMAPDRRSLPAVSTPEGKRVIRGLLKKTGDGGPRLGDPDVLERDHWPQLVTYFDLETIGSALDVSIEPWILLLDEDDQSGFEGRQWKAAVMEPAVHRAYALQWFSLALASLIIWFTLGLRRGGKGVSPGGEDR